MFLVFFLGLFTFSTFSNGFPQPSHKNDCHCLNGGICVQLTSGLSACNCPYGFLGINCEISKLFRSIWYNSCLINITFMY